METDIGQYLINEYKFIGVAIIIMASVIAYLFYDSKKERKEMMKMHKEERKEWRTESKEQFKTIVNVTEKSNTVVQSLKTLIEHRNN